MRPSLLVTFAIIVMTPLALLAWIGAREVRYERDEVARRVRQLLETRLEEYSLRIAEVIQRREQEVQRGADQVSLDAEGLRSWVRKLPCASCALLLGPDRKLQFPPPDDSGSVAEEEFLARARQVLQDRDRFFREPDASVTPTTSSAQQREGASDRPGSRGWYAWYWGDDVQLLFWERLASGAVLGVEMNRARLVADAIAALPAGESTPSELGSDRIRLADSRGETLHQWGSYSPRDVTRPAAAIALAPPLTAWRLEYFPAGAALEESLAKRMTVQLAAGLLALTLVVVASSIYFLRESSRDLREARRRVTLVNQVSHELKTPLTNIRMYAELLQGELRPEEGEPVDHEGPAASAREAKLRAQADVIVAESQRLSRLIANILTFARKQRDTLRLHRRPASVDETIQAVIERFRPALASEGVELKFTGGAPGRVLLDPDALEQILNNLLSNVEKYAPRSGLVEVTSGREGDITRVVVADRGPGIPEKHREEVFLPFRRLSDRLTESTSGTGLGLSIARELARLHGGDVRLAPSTVGARFEVTLETGLPEDDVSRGAA